MIPKYIKIEGVLVRDGKPDSRRIDAVRILLRNSKQVVVFSDNGTDAAREFCRRHTLNPTAALGTPETVIDSENADEFFV